MEDFDNKYQNGKIYKIWSLETDEIYVGSTCCQLYKRMSKHREALTMSTKNHRKLYVEMNRLGKESFSIELIENYPCKTIEELRRREGFWIRELKATLNIQVAGRTAKDYRDEHKHKIKEYLKQYRIDHHTELTRKEKEYREEHKENIKILKKQYYQTNKEAVQAHQKEYRANNREALIEKKKQYYYSNKDKILHQMSEEVCCLVCGCTGLKTNKARHERTQKHLQALVKEPE